MGFNEINRPPLDDHANHTKISVKPRDFIRPASLQGLQGHKLDKLVLDPNREYLLGGAREGDQASTSGDSESERATANYLERIISNESITNADKIEIINQFVASRGKGGEKDLFYLLRNKNVNEKDSKKCDIVYKYVIMKIGEIGDEESAYNLTKMWKTEHYTTLKDSLELVIGKLGDERSAELFCDKCNCAPYMIEKILAGGKIDEKKGESIVYNLIQWLRDSEGNLAFKNQNFVQAIIRIIVRLNGKNAFFYFIHDEEMLRLYIRLSKALPPSSGKASSSRTRSPERRQGDRSGEGSPAQEGQLLDQVRRVLDEYPQMEERENKLKQDMQKLQQDLNRALEQFAKAQQECNQAREERDQARGDAQTERDRFQRQLGDAREECDQARNELREAGLGRDQVLAREKNVEEREKIVEEREKQVENCEKKVKIREGKMDRRSEDAEIARRKSRFMDSLENNIEEILRESPPENVVLRSVRDLYRNRMNPALNLGIIREQFAQDFRDCIERIAEDYEFPEGLHLKYPKNLEAITKIVKSLDEIFQRYDHEDILLIQVRELYTNTLRDTARSGMNRQELAQELRHCVEKLMNDRDVSENIRARVMQYDR